MRLASTYRGARRNGCLHPKYGKPGIWSDLQYYAPINPKRVFHLRHPPIRLNRSQHWKDADSYSKARSNAKQRNLLLMK